MGYPGPMSSPAPRRDDPLASTRRRLTLAAVLAGSFAAALGGSAMALVSLAVVVGVLLGRWRGSTSGSSLSRWRVLNTCALVACVLAAFARLPLVLVALALVGWLQIHRAFTGRLSARDDRIALLLALLQALLGCILSASPLLGPLFILLALVGPAALLACHIGIEAEDARARRTRLVAAGRGFGSLTAGLGLATLVLSAAFFLVLPRMDARGMGASGEDRITGFGDDVELGELGTLLENEAPVMRVRVSHADGRPFTGPLYLRGVALDSFDGRRWSSTVGQGERWNAPGSSPEVRVRQEIQLEPLADNVVFALHELVSVKGIGRRLRRDSNGSIRFDGASARLEYVAWSVPPVADPSRLHLARPDPSRGARTEAEALAAAEAIWTRLPAGLDPRIPAMARRIVDELGPGASPYAQAMALSQHLQREYRYSLSPVAPEGGLSPPDPLSWFLFDARAGHCEYFATALAVMLRSVGLPARVVNGFAGGERNVLGDWVLVRQQDAHSWVELNLGAQGWIIVDPTPAEELLARTSPPWSQVGDLLLSTWNLGVLEYALEDQLAVLGVVGAASPWSGASGPPPELLGLVVVGAALVVGFVGLQIVARRVSGRASRRLPLGRLDRLHQRAWKRVREHGWVPPPAMPPVEASAWVRAQAGEAAEPLVRIAWLRYRARYGEEEEAPLWEQARQALDELQRIDFPRAKPPAKGRATD